MLINDAAEYNAATDRVNSALQTLRDEMVSECFKSRVVLAVINTWKSVFYLSVRPSIRPCLRPLVRQSVYPSY